MLVLLRRREMSYRTSSLRSNFSASAIRPQLEGNGSNPLQTVRQLNSSYQRENTSSFLNRLMSTPPNANTATVSFVNNVGSTQITVSPVVLGFSDGTNISISGRTDTVVNPTSFTISTITATGMSATVVTTAPNGILAGQVVYILGTAIQFSIIHSPYLESLLQIHSLLRDLSGPLLNRRNG